jgi:hypothetical protein
MSHPHATLRRIRVVAGASAVLAAIALSAPVASHAATTCTWGGTPAAPTGVFTVDPGLTNLPLARALGFYATGVLAGGEGCSGRMTFKGQADAGSTCWFAQFEGEVKGLPGVATFFARGNVLAPSFLYDRARNLVGIENADILTPGTLPHLGDCFKPGGFQGGWPGTFSSVVELLDR